MCLFDQIAASQHGRCIANLAMRFGVGEAAAGIAVTHLVDAMTPGLDAWISSDDGMIEFIGVLSRTNFDGVRLDPMRFADPAMRELGDRLVKAWRGAARFDKARLHQAEFGSGMLPVKLDRLMPLVAVQLMAAIQIRAAKPMRAILARRRGQAYALGVREPFAAVLALIAGPTSARPAKGLFEALLEAPMSKGRIAVAGR